MSASPCGPWKLMMSYQRDTEQTVYSQRAKRGRKREDTVSLFSEWRVSEVWTGFHTETMARIHPAALSLLLSLPILRLSICLWAETHGTSCSTQHTSQRFTSCSSALLLHIDPIPRTCINSPPYAQMASGHTNRQANASPLDRYAAPPSVIHINAIGHISNSAHPTEMFSHYLVLPSCRDLEWLWKLFMLWNGKRGCPLSFKRVNEKEWEDRNSHDWHFLLPQHCLHVCTSWLFYRSYPFYLFVKELKNNLKIGRMIRNKGTSCVFVCMCSLSLTPIIQSSLTSGEKGSHNLKLVFILLVFLALGIH